MPDQSAVVGIVIFFIVIYAVTQNGNNSVKESTQKVKKEENHVSSPGSFKDVNDAKDSIHKSMDPPVTREAVTSKSVEEVDSLDQSGSCAGENARTEPCQGTTSEKMSTKYSKRENDKMTINTATGPVEGVELKTPLGKKVNAFLGIPFAEPPLGARRFKPPVPIKPWSQTFQASSVSKHCVQLITPGMRIKGFDWWMPKEEEETTEDCLTLNIWVPQPTPKDAAVLVWIHGGGFEGGSSAMDLYDGQILAAQGDVIVVSINYRLNAFGFLYFDPEEAPGNVGLMDQALGLKWIQDNIKSFGGSPSKVTIFGESAGGASVSHHITIPSSQGLFQRVIAQSGTSNANWACSEKEVATLITEDLARKAGCLISTYSKKDIVDCLRKLDAETIVKISETIQPLIPLLKFTPVVDGVYIPENPKFALENKNFDRNIDLMSGANTGEGVTLLVPFAKALQPTEDSFLSNEGFSATIKALLKTEDETLVNLVKHFYTDWEDPEDLAKIRENVVHWATDLMMLCPTNVFSDLVSDNGNKVFRYQFDHNPSEASFPKWTKSLHGDELYFVFGRPLNPSKSYTEEEVELGKRVIAYWANFAKFGDPNGKSDGNEPKWSKYARDTRAHLTIRLEDRIDYAANLRYQHCSLWDKLLPQFVAASINSKQQQCGKA